MRSLQKSNAHFRKAVTRLPLGVASNFRYWGDDKTIYVRHGKGARIWDIDGNEYIDYRLGYGPAILVEPDSREPWFLSDAHDMECVQETLDKFAVAVDITMNRSPQERRKVTTSYVQ